MSHSKYLLLYILAIFFLLSTFHLSSATLKPRLIARNKHGIPGTPDTPIIPAGGTGDNLPADNASPPLHGDVTPTEDEEEEFDPIADDQTLSPSISPGDAPPPVALAPSVNEEDDFDPIADDKTTGLSGASGNTETPTFPPGGAPTQELPKFNP